MDTLQRNQARLILERLRSKNLYAAEDAFRSMYAERAAQGILRSGATVKMAIRIAEEQASLFLEGAINDVVDIAQDTEAFALLQSSLTDVFRGYEPLLDKAIEKVTIGDPGPYDSVRVAADKLFAEKRQRVFDQLEIHRFTFTRPSMAIRSVAAPSGEATSDRIHSAPKNPGGKPLAVHWDSMWAAIAVRLWTGELNPKSQADLKVAIFDWFNTAEIEIGDTAVTQRARQLWQAMQDADS